MKFNYSIAEHTFELVSEKEQVHSFFAGYRTNDAPEFSISVGQADIEREKEKLSKSKFDPNAGDVRIGDVSFELVAIYRALCERLVENDILLFHSSAISIDGEAVLFTAPSGVGKSTQSRLWKEYFGDRVTIINDDKPLLKISDGKAVVYGTPFSGKSHLHINTSADVKAIVVLHQDSENNIRRLSRDEAFALLLKQAHRPEPVPKLFKALELVSALANCDVYSLGCNISYDAVRLVYKTIFGG